jgi:uncharacterized protein with beta-barrel porin domain
MPTALALALSACLLTACGGGGGGVNGMVRSESVDPPVPPPVGALAESCPPPVTADCTVDLSSADSEEITGGRQSDHALTKRGDGELTLISRPETFGPPAVDYRFSAGTTIEAGSLRVASSANLHSDVAVQTAGILEVEGTLTGNVANDGAVFLWDVVVGDVSNNGVLTPGSTIYDDTVPARINGNFRQTSAGTLDAVIGATTGGFLSVTGRADIDGTLRLVPYGDDWGPYPLPSAPLSLKVLHADGGVFGQFATWTSPGLFITGAPRYLANDVYFDASSISAATAMAAARAGDALTLNAAGHFDAALVSTSGLTPSPGTSLTDAQRRFLASAASIQRIQNYDQAIRTFDSLSGYGYTAAADALMEQAALPAQALVERVANLRPGSAAGAWSARPMTIATGAGAFSEQRSGFDQWLGDALLIGGSVGWSDGNLEFDRSGGNARDRSPQWDFYLRRNGTNDSYVFADVGHGRHELDFGRQIDLGFAKRHVYAMPDLDVEHAWVEAGREFRILQNRVTPFAALSYAAMHAAGFTEQGSTGLELAAQPSFHQRTNAAVGLRLSRYWVSTNGRWTQLNLAGGLLHLLAARGDAYAAFTGAPDVTFALAGLPRQRNTGWLQMSLGTGGENWAWLLNYDRQAKAEAASVGMQFRF